MSNSAPTFRFLVLTDHSVHNKENSLYPLVAMLTTHPACREVWVASRGVVGNEAFFSHMDTPRVLAARADAGFVFEDAASFFAPGEAVDVREFDVVLLRLPRPLPDRFLAFLDRDFPGQLFINHPLGIRETGNKAFLLNFPELCPPMLLCYSARDILEFATRFPIVLKPLKEYGGNGIFRITDGEVYLGQQRLPAEPFLENLKPGLEADGYLAMKYLKNVVRGDKRILVVNGRIIASALRLPAKDSWLCNVAQGGQSVPAVANANERRIIQTLVPALSERGVVVFGADTLADDRGKRVLSEINTLSIGGFPQAQEQTGRPILKRTIRLLMDFVREQRS